MLREKRIRPICAAAPIGLCAIVACFLGCSAVVAPATRGRAPASTPPALATASDVTRVNGVVAVYIEVGGAGASREDICAVAANGQCVPALGVDNAIRMSADAARLANAVSRNESGAVVVAREALGPPIEFYLQCMEVAPSNASFAAALVMGGEAIVLPYSFFQGAYMAAVPEARYRDQIARYSFGENPARDLLSGFVYFPNQTYREIHIDVRSATATTMRLDWPRSGEKTFDIIP